MVVQAAVVMTLGWRPEGTTGKGERTVAQVKTDDLFHSGSAAHAQGLSINDCPYPANTNDHRVWRDGWSQARFADKDENVHDARSLSSARRGLSRR
jgi:ribosome modulation factor